MDMIPLTAIIALALNLVTLFYSIGRLKGDLIEQVRTEEKKWSSHETRIVLLEQALLSLQKQLDALLLINEKIERISVDFTNALAYIISSEREKGGRKQQ